MAEKHFYEQQKHTESYLIPYFDQHLSGWRHFRILEVGCAEAGLIHVLCRNGIFVAGLELMPTRVALAKKMNPELNVQVGDITDPGIIDRFSEPFDLIVMRDVIEHITDRKTAFKNIGSLLKPQGYLYLTFPPRFSPFAGHQQNGKSFMKYLPYLQLLPAWKIRCMGRIFQEQESIIENTIHNFLIGLSIRNLIKLLKIHCFKPVLFECFLSRPVYRTRFGWPVIRFPNLPFFREFIATGCECLVRKETRVKK
ncbi:class I SAM-dependent methyltransferase [bacterium]|nr:class I SAM-dependent methyltransferase [bacterium]RQV97214.1 MAG: class I SAM-dependent methyltransferase [bacterium]